VLATAVWAQREFRIYDSMEGLRTEAPLPPDFATPAEFVHGRLMYPSGDRRGFRGGGNWLAGRTTWTIDYPKADRLFAAMLRRLTRIDGRSVESDRQASGNNPHVSRTRRFPDVRQLLRRRRMAGFRTGHEADFSRPCD
jgi:hypothetical protein